MGNLTEHFSRREFECPCGCAFDTADHELLMVLEKLRTFFNAHVAVSSGCRCRQHNRLINGSLYSKHLWGQAADIQVEGYSPKLVADYLEDNYPDKYGIGRYPAHTHIDVRRQKARWAVT